MRNRKSIQNYIKANAQQIINILSKYTNEDDDIMSEEDIRSVASLLCSSISPWGIGKLVNDQGPLYTLGYEILCMAENNVEEIKELFKPHVLEALNKRKTLEAKLKDLREQAAKHFEGFKNDPTLSQESFDHLMETLWLMKEIANVENSLKNLSGCL